MTSREFARIEQFKKFMWITTCISSAVLENRNFRYVFRPQPNGKQFGLLSTDFIAKYSQEKLGKAPADLRVAIIHEDGAYGIDVSTGNEEGAKKAGFNIVLKESYAATAPDLSSLVTKLKRARPDIIFHTGYNPDITLLLRQPKSKGCASARWSATAPVMVFTTSSRNRWAATSTTSLTSTRSRSGW